MCTCESSADKGYIKKQLCLYSGPEIYKSLIFNNSSYLYSALEKKKKTKKTSDRILSMQF